MWKLKTYVLNDGSGGVACWWAAYPGNKWVRLRARFYNVVMVYLARQPTITDWINSGKYHHLKGFPGLGRIGFDYQNIAYRIIGFFGPAEREFTILYFAEEHDDVYLPKGCIEEAQRRMEETKRDRTKSRPFEIRDPHVR